MKMIDLHICNHFLCIQESDIVIYGTGHWGEQTYQILKKANANIQSVCNTEKVDDLFHNYSILSIKDIKEKYDKSTVLIIIASLDYYEEMIKNCENQEFSHARVCSVYAIYQSIFMHCDDSCMPENLRIEMTHCLQVSEKRMEYQEKLYALDMLIRAAGESDVFIYQPGKVGSQSVWKSIGGNSLQFHSLVIPFAFQEFSRKQLEYYIDKIRNKKVKIITGIREPISRDLAAMFQNSDIDLWPYHQFNSNIFWLYGDFLGDERGWLNHSDIMKRTPRWEKNLENAFFDLSNAIIEYRLDEFSWFSYEIKRVFGINVFQEPFDKEKGYGIIRKENVEILIYKLESLDTLECIIGEFLGEDEFQLKRKNVSEKKIYNTAYHELKKVLRISKKYFQYYYKDNSAYSHFYTDDEINYYRKIWEVYIDERM